MGAVNRWRGLSLEARLCLVVLLVAAVGLPPVYVGLFAVARNSATRAGTADLPPPASLAPPAYGPSVPRLTDPGPGTSASPGLSPSPGASLSVGTSSSLGTSPSLEPQPYLRTGTANERPPPRRLSESEPVGSATCGTGWDWAPADIGGRPVQASLVLACSGGESGYRDYPVPMGATTLVAVIGIDDRPTVAPTAATFEVSDHRGAPLLSPVTLGYGQDRAIAVPVGGALWIRLAVRFGGSGRDAAQACWGAPAFVFS